MALPICCVIHTPFVCVEVVEAKITEVKINEARENYRPAAERASLLYFILNDLNKINPIYQFSLKVRPAAGAGCLPQGGAASGLHSQACCPHSHRAVPGPPSEGRPGPACRWGWKRGSQGPPSVLHPFSPGEGMSCSLLPALPLVPPGTHNPIKTNWMAWHGGSCLSSQHYGGPRRVDHLRSGVQDQPDQHGETLSVLKIKKLARCGGVRLGRLRQENRLNTATSLTAEGAVSQDHATALQPGRQSETLSQTNKTNWRPPQVAGSGGGEW